MDKSLSTKRLAEIDEFIMKLDQASQRALESIAIRQTFTKGDYLLRANEICRSSFLIAEGIARKYFLTETGKEITSDFYFKNDLAVSFQSYINFSLG